MRSHVVQVTTLCVACFGHAFSLGEKWGICMPATSQSNSLTSFTLRTPSRGRRMHCRRPAVVDPPLQKGYPEVGVGIWKIMAATISYLVTVSKLRSSRSCVFVKSIASHHPHSLPLSMPLRSTTINHRTLDVEGPDDDSRVELGSEVFLL